MVPRTVTAHDGRKRPRAYRKHGSSTLIARLRAGGLDSLDGRLALVREARQWAADYAAGCGGEEVQGPGWLELLKVATVKHTMAEHVGGVLMAQPGWIVNRRRRQLSQLARDYVSLTKALREDLIALGLERRVKPAPSLSEYLAQRAAAASASRQDAPAAVSEAEEPAPGAQEREQALEPDEAAGAAAEPEGAP